MKHQPNTGTPTNDIVYTPPSLAGAIVRHFHPTGKCLDPACGDGAFLQFLPEGSDWCEIEKGRDFFAYKQKVDWIVTNPPWSKMRDFLLHSYEIADDIVYFVTANHLFTKRRLSDMEAAGFGMKEILCCDTPANFPTSGFQCAAMHIRRGWDMGRDGIRMTRLRADGKGGFFSVPFGASFSIQMDLFSEGYSL